MTRERVSAEATALWQEVFGEPPPVSDGGGLMLQVILENLPALSYERFANSALDRDVVWPGSAPAGPNPASGRS